MLEQLVKYNLSSSSWAEVFSNFNPIALEVLEWELSEVELYSKYPTINNIVDGYRECCSRSALFKSTQYKDMLSICKSINVQDVIYEPGKADYWKRIHDFIVKLFEDVPALGVTKETLLDGEGRRQIYRESKTNEDLLSIINNISDDGDLDEQEGTELSKLYNYLTDNASLIGIGHKVADDRTEYTILFKRRAILKSVLYAIEYLLRRYETGEDPSSWRHV